MDVDARLKYLDEEYLSDFDAADVDIHADIPLQKAFDKPVYETKPYAITDDEPLEDNTYLSYNVVTGTSVDAKLYLAMQILDYALVMTPGAPLKQGLIDAGISTDVYSSFETSLYQPVYSIVAKNANEKDKDAFVKLIEDVLKELVKNGINERTIAAGINYYEFKYREADYGPYPKGLMYYLTMMDSWLYDESKPFIHIEASDTFKELKEDAKKGYFEKLIEEYILNNNHKSVIGLVPEYGLEKKKEEEEARKLSEYKKTLSEDELKALVKDTKALKEYQDTPSSKENLEKIPMLELSDISREPAEQYIDVKDVAGMKVVHHNLFTNKIAYVLLSFNTQGVSDEDIPYLGLLGSVLGLMDTKNFTYQELMNEININCGGISSSAAVYTDKADFSKNSIMYEFKGKALYDKIPFVLDMMKEIMYNTKFTDYKRLKEIIARIRSRFEATMSGSGHSIVGPLSLPVAVRWPTPEGTIRSSSPPWPGSAVSAWPPWRGSSFPHISPGTTYAPQSDHGGSDALFLLFPEPGDRGYSSSGSGCQQCGLYPCGHLTSSRRRIAGCRLLSACSTGYCLTLV